MLLRALLTNYLREHAAEKIFEAARGASGSATQPGEPIKPIHCDVAIVFTLSIEAGGLADVLTDIVTMRCNSFVEHVGLLNGRPVVLVETGVGVDAAATATREVIALHKVSCVIATGFGSALRPELRRGHFLMADEVANIHGHHVAVDLHVRRDSLASNPTLHVGRLLTVDHLLQDADEKQRLGSNHDAMACDMESLGIAEECHRQGIRFLSVKIISEALDDALPKEVERMIGQKTIAGKLGAAAGALWNRPSSVKDLWQLKEDAIKASDRLAKFLVGVVGNLPPNQ
jgi:adenosylhomocysteine nucleosidase